MGMRSTTLLITAMIIAATLVSGALVGYDSASAQGTAALTVNTKVDESNTDGDCSLREAIEAANTNAKVDRCKAGSATEEDAIYFALGEKAKIVLGSQLPTITDASGLTIDGQKAKITVSGNHAVRVFEVGSSAAVNLRKLKVADGNSDDFGGGAFNNAGGTLTVTKSTFSGNSATDLGGGIDNRGTLEVTNSTFSANKTTRADGNNFGGGIFNDGTLKVSKSTFSNNSSTQLSGGAIRNQEQLGPFPGAGATVTLSNTIVANSPSGGNCGGPIIDGGFNVDDGTTCGFSAANISEPTTDPLLGLLANNGGPTKTHALLRGSPAIDAIPDGTNGCGTVINTDQRGVERPQGSRCDIGAYEKKVRSR
jgi:CSLREA domain-containing protein